MKHAEQDIANIQTYFHLSINRNPGVGCVPNGVGVGNLKCVSLSKTLKIAK